MKDLKIWEKERAPVRVSTDDDRGASFVWDAGDRLDQVLSDRLSLRRTAQVFDKPGWWRLLEGC